MVNLTICSSGVIETHQQIVLSALNISLSFMATVGNILIIVALQKPSSLHPPSKLLLGCLAVADLCVSLIIQPVYAIHLMSSEHYKRCYYVQLTLGATSTFFSGVSLMTMTAISVDRLLALMLGLRYRQVVTLRRVWVLVTFIWLYNTAVLATLFFNADIFFSLISIDLILWVIISTCCYSKIYLRLRQHQAHVQDHVHQGQLNGGGIGINVGQYKKTVSSALWVQTVCLVCYVPFGLAEAVVVITGLATPSLYLAMFVAFLGVLSNSTLNPFLYCWKIKEVRQAVKDTIRGFFQC